MCVTVCERKAGCVSQCVRERLGVCQNVCVCPVCERKAGCVSEFVCVGVTDRPRVLDHNVACSLEARVSK